MSLKKYYVIEELYELSQKSNEIIDKLYSETALNFDYFDEVKREISEIQGNKSKKREFKNNLTELVKFQSKVDHYLEPFFETRVTIHKRQGSKMANETSSPSRLDLRVNSSGVKDFQMSPDYLSNQSVPVNNRNCETEPTIERDVCNTLCQLQKGNRQRYSKSNFICTPSNSLRFWNNKSMNSREDSMELSPNFDKSKPSQVHETFIISSSGDNLCERKDISVTKSKDRANLKSKKVIKLYSDELVENSDQSSASSINISDKIYVVSSESSAEKNGRSTSLSSTFVSSCDSGATSLKNKKAVKLYSDELVEKSYQLYASSINISDKTYVVSLESSAGKNDRSASVSGTFESSCDSSIFSLGNNENNEHKNKIRKLKKRNKGLGKDYSRPSAVIKNTRDKAIHKLNQDRLRARTSDEFKEILVGLKKQNLFQHEVKHSSISYPSIEDERELSDSKPVMRYMLRSHEKRKRDGHKPLTDMEVSSCTRNSVSEEKLSESITDLQSSPFPAMQGNKNFRNLPGSSNIPKGVKEESCRRRKKTMIGGKANAKKGKMAISNFGGRKYKKNPKREKNCPTQPNSSPARVKKKTNANRNPRPITPIEFLDTNRESLKVKAEEKRRERESRMQKTKERRERLELEKDEKIRQSQQRLKQRFQQHEEMLKQKIEKFKIKSRNRQRRYTKRSDASTSSRKSKDRTKDNDDFCRNSINSGQKLSKESNGYSDVSLEKESPTSLEGDVGQHPEISKKQNAIPVGCEKTPVELLVSSDGMNLKKLPAVENEIRLKDSKSCGSNTDGITLDLKNSCSNKVPSKNKYPKVSNWRTGAKSLGFKRNNYNIATSKQMQNTNDCKKVKIPNLLKSSAKLNKRKDIAAVLPLNVEEDKHTSSNHEKQDHDNITSSSETAGKTCSKFCFKVLSNRAKKKGKVPLYCQPITSNGLPMQTRKDKCILQSSEKGVPKKSTSTETQEIISYTIPDSDDESSEETIVDFRKIPRWATGIYLKQAIIQQYYFPPHVENIFGLLSTKPIKLTELFDRDKPEYHRRTSSENWSLNLTPQ